MFLKDIKSILDKYDAKIIKEKDNFFPSDTNAHCEIDFITKKDLEKILSFDKSFLEHSHNNSPTIEELITINQKFCYSLRIDLLDDLVVYLDVDSIYVPMFIENFKLNNILSELGGCDSVAVTTHDDNQYLCLWWD